MLENVRFEPGETKNDPELAAALAALADVYVDDAFGAAHRAHASTEGVARLIPVTAAGLLLEREVETLTGLLEHPTRPLVAVLGGAKVTDKIGVIERVPRARRRAADRRRDVLPVLRGAGPRRSAPRCASPRTSSSHATRRARQGARRQAAAAGRSRDRGPSSRPTRRSGALDGVDVPDGRMGLDIGPDIR